MPQVSEASARDAGRTIVMVLGLALLLMLSLRAVWSDIVASSASSSSYRDSAQTVVHAGRSTQASAVAVWPSAKPGSVKSRGPSRPSGSSAHWRQVLNQLSRLRAEAWQRGRPALLRKVYDPSAFVLRKDAYMLSRYVDRGLRVRGVRLAFGRVRVQRRQDTTVWLRVTDQLASAVAVGPAGRRIALPQDRPSRHLLVLRRRSGRWWILAVRP